MKQHLATLAVISLTPLPYASAPAQGLDDGDAVRCIGLQRIDHTEVIDDSTIAFFMKGRDIYVNHLARECPGLAREKRFSYRSATGNLCSVDTITVLDNLGFGLRAGATCGLGMFIPTSEEQIESLKAGPQAGDVSVEEVEIEESDQE
jgi:hypothetical protein